MQLGNIDSFLISSDSPPTATEVDVNSRNYLHESLFLRVSNRILYRISTDFTLSPEDTASHCLRQELLEKPLLDLY